MSLTKLAYGTYKIKSAELKEIAESLGFCYHKDELGHQHCLFLGTNLSEKLIYAYNSMTKGDIVFRTNDLGELKTFLEICEIGARINSAKYKQLVLNA